MKNQSSKLVVVPPTTYEQWRMSCMDQTQKMTPKPRNEIRTGEYFLKGSKYRALKKVESCARNFRVGDELIYIEKLIVEKERASVIYVFLEANSKKTKFLKLESSDDSNFDFKENFEALPAVKSNPKAS